MLTKRNETEDRKALIKNGKYFVPPKTDDRNFKALFKRLASAGAGRPVDANGFPQGPWTPDLLAEAVSQIDQNRSGIELRTVQLWFQDNEKGISADNIRWLARVFGCDDPDATSGWQAELSAAQSRLTAERRQGRQQPESSVKKLQEGEREAYLDGKPIRSDKTTRDPVEKVGPDRTNLATRSEAILSGGSILDLPSSVFAGAVGLGFMSFFLKISNVTYTRDDGVLKQVGYLWAPNWTLLFMVFMPLFFAFVVEILDYWKKEGRPRLSSVIDAGEGSVAWTRKVEASSYTYWAVFLICVGFAGIFQWVSVRLLPLLDGSSEYAPDWGSIGTGNPDVLSFSQAAMFTGSAYLYMCLCFYLFFVGLILLFTVTDDFRELNRGAESEFDTIHKVGTSQVANKIMWGIFRCTVCGLLVSVCMKVQSSYLTTPSENVLAWLVQDFLSVFSGPDGSGGPANYSSPTQFTSLVVALATCVVFLYAFVRLGLVRGFGAPLGKMFAVVVLLAASYLLIDAFEGFSIFLSVSVAMSIYGLFDPGFGTRQMSKSGDSKNVL